MKKLSILTALAMPALAIFASCSDESTTLTPSRTQASARVGNGAPTGAHYNLNIIGVPKGKSADMTGNNGGRIFVALDGKTRINLYPGTDFQVTDANGTDANGASFTLPDPDPESDGTTTYSVFARVPGNQRGNATLTTCADGVVVDGEEIAVELDCDGITFDASNFKKFTNVSAELLYVTILTDVALDTDDDGVIDYTLKAGRYPIFDERLYGFFWEYDNQGLKLLQLRFYPISTTVDGVVTP
ncbi:hypothetical protein GCM10023189_11380 [Nibrella saemangeumensis]|uniref:Lipoprotein n=1 Tax=Nibrella saemangeumensis TaxID=1084526 RepID=A0ABP8MH06_9BACT